MKKIYWFLMGRLQLAVLALISPPNCLSEPEGLLGSLFNVGVDVS